MPHRLVQLTAGLALYGASIAVMVRSDLGLGPWSVFHQGLSARLGLSIGLVTNIVGALLLLVWIPLRQRPGLGTIGNVLLIGTCTDLTLALLPPLHGGLAMRVAAMVCGVGLNGVAGALYIGAGLGPGPRDGLMTGLVKLTGRPVAQVRTGLELLVLAAGFLLGGAVGPGTLLYALAVGPLLGACLPILAIRNPREAPVGIN